MTFLKHAVLVLIMALLAGCPKPVTTPPDDGGASSIPDSSVRQGVETPGTAVPTPLTPAERARLERERLLADRVIYFDYNRTEIRREFQDQIAAHARELAANPSRRVRLEGHTDERGSREYNIGLGERRVQSVRRSLLLQGVASGQVTTVSFGEEKPAVQGHDERSWSRNRRVEIVYTR